jgi:glycosyltransferase involved in cell wall biosynthesis
VKYPVLFVIGDLRGGGAERALVNFLRHFSRDKFELHLALFQKWGVHLDDLPDDIILHDLNKKSPLDLPKLAFRLRALVKKLKPIGVVSFMWYANLVQLLSRKLPGESWPALIILQNVWAGTSEERFGSSKTYLMKRLYPTADAILGVSQAVVDEMIELLPRFCHGRLDVQFNPWPIEMMRKQAEGELTLDWSDDELQLFGVGRLVPQKAWDVLIKALHILGKSLPWRLTIAGQGELEADLKALTEKLDLSDRINFAGYIHQPYPLMRRADLFIQPSRFEGLPGVLIEALSVGAPILATDCPGGSKDILLNGKYGCLVPNGDSEAMAEAIDDLLRTPEKRQIYRTRTEEGSARFEAKTVTLQLEEQILRLGS